MQRSLFIAKVLRKLKIIQNGWLRVINFTLVRNTNHFRLKIPIINNIGWNNIFENEPWMTEILEILVHENQGIFIDVGVNIGQTLLKLKSTNQNIEYFGFEVNPSCIVYLKELIKINRFQHTNLFPFGLSDKTGLTELQFYYDSEEDATASIISNYRPNDLVLKREYVITFRLDDLELVTQNIVGVLKIDVEGAELEVLSGAKKTLSKSRPVIIIEILPAYSAENEYRINRQNQIESIFKDLNYEIFRIEKNKTNQFTGLRRLNSFQVDGNISQRDYILIPGEKSDKISSVLPD